MRPIIGEQENLVCSACLSDGCDDSLKSPVPYVLIHIMRLVHYPERNLIVTLEFLRQSPPDVHQ